MSESLQTLLRASRDERKRILSEADNALRQAERSTRLTTAMRLRTIQRLEARREFLIAQLQRGTTDQIEDLKITKANLSKKLADAKTAELTRKSVTPLIPKEGNNA